MVANSELQIVPFPLPHYLATYFASKITTEPIISADGSYVKPFSIKRDSAFGAFIFRCFSKSEKPVVLDRGFTFFIQFKEHQTAQEANIVNARYSFVDLKPETVKEINKVFKAVFDESLKSYVAGAEEVTRKFVDRKRGIQKEAIINFCKKNKVTYTNQNLQAWVKMIYRDKKRVNVNKTNVL